MIRSLLCIVFTALCMGACSTSHDNENYTGTLYFAWGQTLYAMNMHDRQVRVAYENPEIVMDSLEKLDDQHLLLDYRKLENQSGDGGIFRVLIINRLNGSVSPYVGTISGLGYLPESKIIIFFELTKPNSNHWSLYWANVDTPLQPHLVDDTGTSGTIIVISNHQVVYTVGTLGGNFRIKIYDFETHQSSLLNISDCNPIIWRSKTSQLVCSQIAGKHDYYLVHLDGSDKIQLHDTGIFTAPLMVAYIEKYDIAVMSWYGSVRFSFSHGFYDSADMYLYDFQTKKLINISSDYATTPRAAVWYP